MKKMEWGEDPELSGPRNYYRESMLIQEIRKRKKRGKILDFGCGSGSLLMRIAKYGYIGEGIDISKSAIKYARKKTKDIKNHKKIHFSIGSDKSLFKKTLLNKFDIVFSGETIEHIKNDQRVIEGFYAVLKKNGICAVSVPAHMNLWDINDDFSSHFKRYEKKSFIQIFKNAGFSIITCYYWGYPICLFWHKVVYLPIVAKKMEENKTYSKSSGILGYILSKDMFKSLLSYPFWIDSLFNWTGKGGGLILVAKK